MDLALNLLIKIVISGLLIYAAVIDLKKREVPYVAGIGIMLFGAISLFWEQHWLLGVFYLAAVMGSRGGLWGLAAVALALTTLASPRAHGRSIPIYIGDILHYYDVQVWCIWTGRCGTRFWSISFGV